MKRYAFVLAVLLPCLAASVGDGEKSKALGSPGAPVRIDLYSDFQCPACKGFHETVLPNLVRDYIATGKVYFVCHEFPLPMHPYSREAANEATAAAKVGKYSQVADALFKNQTTWAANGRVWDTVASVLTPAEQKKVQTLSKDPAILQEVQTDLNMGNMERVTQTPTIVVSRGAKRYPFPGPSTETYTLLKSLIDGLLR